MKDNKKDIPNLNIPKNEFLANCIFIFHLFVVAFIIFVPFLNIPALLILHIVSCLSLFVHWGGSSDVCSLTVLEANLRGIDRQEGFLHQFVSPVYKITSTEWSNIVWILTSILACISIYKLYYSEKLKISLELYNNDTDKTWDKTLNYFRPLFVLE